MSDRFTLLKEILHERYSCRAYLDADVPDNDVREIVAAASRAPTWCNAQPWEVIVTRGQATRAFAEVLTTAAMNTEMKPDFEWPERYTGVYQDRRRVCGYQLYDALEIDRNDRPKRDEQMMRNFSFFGAPHVAIVTTEAELGAYGAMDCGGFIALFAIAARAKGIATVVQASVTGYAPTIRDHFGIPENRLIQTAITFGYEDRSHPSNSFRTERADVDSVVTFVG